MSVRLSVCLSVPAAEAAGGFAAEVGRGQLDIDRQLLLPSGVVVPERTGTPFR